MRFRNGSGLEANTSTAACGRDGKGRVNCRSERRRVEIESGVSACTFMYALLENGLARPLASPADRKAAPKIIDAAVVFEERTFEGERGKLQRRRTRVTATSPRLAGARDRLRSTPASSFPSRRCRGAIMPARLPAELPCAHRPDARAGEHPEVVQKASVGCLVQDEEDRYGGVHGGIQAVFVRVDVEPTGIRRRIERVANFGFLAVRVPEQQHPDVVTGSRGFKRCETAHAARVSVWRMHGAISSDLRDQAQRRQCHRNERSKQPKSELRVDRRALAAFATGRGWLAGRAPALASTRKARWESGGASAKFKERKLGIVPSRFPSTVADVRLPKDRCRESGKESSLRQRSYGSFGSSSRSLFVRAA